MLLSYASIIHLLKDYFRKKDGVFPSIGRHPFFQINFFDFEISDLSSELVTRNRVFLVRNTSYKDYDLLVKQVLKFEREYTYTLQVEAELYDIVKQEKELNRYFPKSYGYDTENHMLIRQWYGAFEVIDFKKNEQVLILQKLAGCLMTFKDKLAQALHVSKLLQKTLPSIILTYQESKYDFIKKVGLPIEIGLYNYLNERDDLKKVVLKAITSYRFSEVIHGDLKFQNMLWNEQNQEIMLIDWESGRYGDFRWDFGAIIADIVTESYNPLRIGSSSRKILTLVKDFTTVLSSKDAEIAIVFAGVKLLELRLNYCFEMNIEFVMDELIETMLLNPKEVIAL